MKCKVIAQIEKHKMLSPGDTVIVALSGGADSMTLLHVLYSLKDEYDIRIIAAHVNHCLRGEEADRDENFVRKTCADMGIELRVLRADVASLAKERGEGTEETGRKIRYEFFNSIDKNAKIATAHTLSDNLETVLLNLTRGTTLNGLCGIPAVRDKVIRPLLTCTRAEIEAYCTENGINYVTDSTNLTNDYNRNRMRNKIIPLLKEINPLVEYALLRCTESLTEDETFFEEQAQSLITSAKTDKGYDAGIMAEASPIIRRRAIRLLIHGMTNGNLQKHHIELIDSLLFSQGAVQISKRYTAFVKNGILSFKKTDVQSDKEEITEVPFDVGEVKLPHKTAFSEIIYKSDINYIQTVHKNILEKCFDYDKIIGKAFFRSRREGDKIKQCSGKCTKSLKKLFSEKKIPQEERDRVTVLADEYGVVWVEGYGCDERCKIDENTERILKIVIK